MDKENAVRLEATTPPPNAALHIERKRHNFDGSKPLRRELELIAEFLATPKEIRDFKRYSDLAAHLGVARMTIYRWTRLPDVLARADFLLKQHQLRGDLVARLYWERIVMGQVRAALQGNTQAAVFCERRAWSGPFD